MLHAALLLPDLPIEVYARAATGDDAGRAFAVASGGSRPVVVAANAAARAAGVKRGQPVAGALALVPGLLLRDRDDAAEAQALEAVATWALSFTPAVSLAPPRAVLAEIGGSRKLFGGLTAIADALARGLEARGHAARLAIAPTPLAALVLARARRPDPVLDMRALAPALAELPLAALDLDARLLATLAAAGVRTIGAADALPRDGLARRFGAPLVDALDRVHGRVPDPRLPWTPPPSFCGRLALPAPAHDAAALGFAARRLAQELAAWLNARGLGVLRFELALAHERWQHARVGRHATTIALSFAAPARALDHLATVLVERLARVELPAPVEGLALTTLETAPLAGRLLSLLPGDEGDAPAVPLVDRLRARLGDEAVMSYATHDEHRPERALSAVPYGTRAADGAVASLPDAPRPLWLLPAPAPIGAAIAHAPWVLHDGPERIESGWWDGHDVRRDYYVAETPRGERAWIYRDHRRGTDDGEWWLHGWFA
ncbi:MAG TPA: DNA polymerase Y family protein [Casimicrobiaceae bacterium]|nr:DNA polymerase Y family protein [Casimicrobiaceae bacterium]